MMANGHRRSADDPKWLATKSIVDKRDKRSCQFARCLSAKEAHQLISGIPTTLDRAHIFSAANYPDMIYNAKNVITLRRFIHRRLDDYQCPLTGQTTSIQEHYWWWYRIVTHQMIKYDETIDYEELLLSAVR